MPAFRAKQILEWVYQKGVADPGQMSNLSKLDRDTLAREMTFHSGDTVSHQKASDGTQKLLIQWEDFGSRESGVGSREDQTHDEPVRPSLALPLLPNPDSRLPNPVPPPTLPLDSSRQTECVMIPAGGTPIAAREWDDGDDDDDRAGQTRLRRTACISSQVGCPVGCKFCASGIGGLDGNLSAGRIVEQVWRLNSILPRSSPNPESRFPTPDSPPPTRITNIVFMGMGEPLSNFAAVTRAIKVLNAPWGMGIGARRITISTVGLPKAIEKLAEEFDLPVTLALSLHAPNDDIRRTLIPWAEYTNIPDLMSACRKWFDKTGREITLEYILLGGVNDQPEHARELAQVARTLRANVNLIRYNEVKGMPFARPIDQDVLTFQKILRDARVNVHIRASRGRDIAAACGQLRHEKSAAQDRPAEVR